MRPRTTNEQLDAVAAGQAVAQSGAVHELLDQADAVLNRLVGSYRARTLTDREASVGIATIAELRSAAEKANRVVMRGSDAGDQLTRSPQ